MDHTYRYTQLPHQRHIRLFKFEPAPELCVAIHVADLDKICPQYATVSYTWNAPFNTPSSIEAHADDSTLKVSVNNGLEKLAVKQNLLEALLQIKSSGFTGYFWADAICINLEDAEERVSQVLLMGEIYAGAERVISWLGKKDEYTEDVVWFHRVLWGRLQQRKKPLDLDYTLTAGRLVEALELDDPGDKWVSLISFYMHCRYFSRAWVAQEIIISRAVVLLYGPNEIEWSSLVGLNEICRLTSVANFFYKIGSRGAVGTGCAAELQYLDDLRQSHIQGGPDSEHLSPLLSRVYGAETARQRQYAYSEWMLTYARRFEATLLHDQVCSIVGVLTLYSPEETTIVPNYGVDPVSFFTYVAERLISVAPSLTMLSLVEDPSLRRLSDLPSWVPDFSAHPHVDVAHLGFKERLACLDGLDIKRNWAVRENQLHVRAYPLDVVSYAVHTMRTSTGTIADRKPMPLGDIIQFLAGLLKVLTLMDAQYFDGHSALHALICALEANMRYDEMDQRASMFISTVRTVLAGGMHVSQKRAEDDPWNDSYQSALSEALDLLHELPSLGLPTRRDVDAVRESFRTPAESRSARDEENFREHDVALASFGTLIARVQELRRTVLTRKKYIGLGPLSSRVDDGVWLIQGARLPFILRCVSGNQHKLIGEVFIQGIMQGELVPDIKMEDFEEIVVI